MWLSVCTVWVLVLFKGAYVLCLTLALCHWPQLEVASFFGVKQHWPREGGPVFSSHFATWDAAHYLHLSGSGYQAGDPSCAFYPLWPLLLCGFSPVVGDNHVLAALVLANALSLAGWVFFHRVVARRWGESAASWALVFLVAFPGSLFFQFNYSESVFLLLVVLLWWALEEGRPGWAALAAGLLPLTRGVGIFVVLPIAWYALKPVAPWLKARAAAASGGAGANWKAALAWGQSGNRGPGQVSSPGEGVPAAFPLGDAAGRAWLLAPPLLGWAAYLALMGAWTGNPFEGFAAQKHWGVHAIGNLWDVPKFVVGFFTPSEWHAFRGSLLDRCGFVLVVYCLPVIWRLDKGLLVWIYVLGVLPAMSGTFTSFTRFASCAFPVFIALGVVFKPEQGGAGWSIRACLRWVVVLVFVVLHGLLVWRFVNFRWAG
ncbi:MAG: hypothetical protein FJ387_24325 [Verrucomicrobia bacterium]|nr:hypothetical protein [Verrucomicrobiota bacterium]